MALSTSTKPKKRKFTADLPLEALEESFVLHGVVSSTLGDVLRLQPICAVARTHIPLSCLKPTTSAEGSIYSHFYSTDEEVPRIDSSVGNLLLVQCETIGKKLILERVDKGLYSLHQLDGYEVNSSLVEKASTIPPVAPRPSIAELHEGEWWRAAATNKPTRFRNNRLPHSTETTQPNFCLERPSNGQPMSARPVSPVKQDHQNLEILQNQELLNPVPHNPEPSDLDDILTHVGLQYQEALYLSKASLAYFAKGPLSRARARFLLENPEICGLLTKHLSSMVIPLTMMDKKYRETVPNAVRELPLNSLSEGDGASIVEAIMSKTRKAKKGKLGKDALLPGERANLIKWWFGHHSIMCSHENEEYENKASCAVTEQRTRETKLQLILILEILALQAHLATQESLSQMAAENSQGQAEVSRKSKSAKEPQDLRTLLELLADRLCIWQSMNSSPKKLSTGLSALNTADETALPGYQSDLRQFCIDVVIPFYSARLPAESLSLCKKLGVPAEASPLRPAVRPLSQKPQNTVRPGEPLRRKSSGKSRRTLERVLTEDKSHPRRTPVPSLSRSMTEPTLGHIKREVSDVTLSSIPVNRVVMTKRYSQREVDLQAKSQETEARLKRKIAVEQELQGAIAALKRPNAREAVKEFVAAADKRHTGLKVKKAKKLAKNSLRDVQIEATPRKPETSKILDPKSLLVPSNMVPTNAANDAYSPPSSVIRMPAAAENPEVIKCPNSIVSKRPRAISASLDQTPTRASIRSGMRLQLQPQARARTFASKNLGELDSSNVPQSTNRDGLTFPVTDLRQSLLPMPTPSMAFETPSQELDSFNFNTTEIMGQATPCKGPTQTSRSRSFEPASAVDEETELYTALGWTYDVNE